MTQPLRKAFIVDDHETIRVLLAEYIETASDLAMCGTAASGEEALARISPTECDLVLVDVRMPGMSGIELVRHLKQRYPEIRCLMFSGHAEQVYVEQALAAGARGYVMKGNPEELLQAIRHVLSGKIYLSDPVRRDRSGGDELESG